MTLQVSKWKVRDGSDLSEVGLAALAFRRAQRGRTQVDDAKYYWAHPGEIWILVEGQEELVLTSNQTSESYAALYDLNELAVQSESVLLSDARSGVSTYEAAGRA